MKNDPTNEKQQEVRRLLKEKIEAVRIKNIAEKLGIHSSALYNFNAGSMDLWDDHLEKLHQYLLSI